MMQLVFHRFPTVDVEYHFTCRTPGIDLSPFANIIQDEINALCEIDFNSTELEYLEKLPYFKADYIHYLKSFRLNRNHIQIKTHPHFDIVIKGPWLQTILFEVPLLAIVTETYYRNYQSTSPIEIGQQRLSEKIDLVLSKTPPGLFKFIEFGTRRRFSYSWHQSLLSVLKSKLPDNLIGSSNVYFANKLQLLPKGTMAHEYIQAFQALAADLRISQILAFKTWLEEYHQELSIVLSDTYTQEIFFKDFSKELAREYKGVRQDSGDPFEWAEHLISHYTLLGIDPLSKTIIFSDALTFDLAILLFQRFHDRIQTVFAIGTNITNDVGYDPIQIVIKMTHCNGKPVAKLTDSPAKTLSHDQVYLDHLKKVFQI
jgi:nicotinate phosphoribosyltransferase